MSSTVVERVLFPNCSVAAELSRIGQGMEWQSFLNRAMENSLITWAFETTYGSAIVGHANSLASLETHISTFASKSYSISTALPIARKPFMTAGEASGQIKRQTSSADQYAWIKIQAAPMPGSDTVRLSIPHSHTVAAELHDPGSQTQFLTASVLPHWRGTSLSRSSGSMSTLLRQSGIP